MCCIAWAQIYLSIIYLSTSIHIYLSIYVYRAQSITHTFDVYIRFFPLLVFEKWTNWWRSQSRHLSSFAPHTHSYNRAPPFTVPPSPPPPWTRPLTIGIPPLAPQPPPHLLFFQAHLPGPLFFFISTNPFQREETNLLVKGFLFGMGRKTPSKNAAVILNAEIMPQMCAKKPRTILCTTMSNIENARRMPQIMAAHTLMI